MRPQVATLADATLVVSDFRELLSRVAFGMRAELGIGILAMEWKDSVVYLA